MNSYLKELGENSLTAEIKFSREQKFRVAKKRSNSREKRQNTEDIQGHGVI